MNRITKLRTLILLLMVGIMVAGLTSCKLPASKGPTTEASGFPVPESSQTTSGSIDVSSLATQTAQALPGFVTVTPAVPSSIPTATLAGPMPTSVPSGPVPTETSIVYIQATPGGPPATYTLAQGEYPYCIARRFNVDISELLAVNGLSSNSYTYAGQVLNLPQTGNTFAGERALKPHPDYYKIQSGDTLNTIACSYGDVSPDMIALQNNLISEDLPAGEVLIIP
jgi:LysM repeat protein